MNQTYKEQSKAINLFMAKIILPELSIGGTYTTLSGIDIMVIDRRFNFFGLKWEFYTTILLEPHWFTGNWINYRQFKGIKYGVIDPHDILDEFWIDPTYRQRGN